MPSSKVQVSTTGLIAAVTMGIFVVPLNATMLTVVIVPIRENFDISTSWVAWLISGYLIGMAVAHAVGGRLGDQHGRRRVYVTGIVYFAAASVLAMAAWDFWSLVFFRINQAAAGGLLIPNGIATLREHLPTHLRGRGFGISGAFVAVAAGVGPPLGGALVSAFGWQMVFGPTPPLCIGALFLAFRFIPSDAQTAASQRSLDMGGVLLLLLALTCLALTSTWIGTRGSDGPGGAMLLGAATLLWGGLFLWRQRRASSPLIELGLFRVRSYAAASTANFLSNLIMYTLLLLIPLYIQDMRGGTPAQAGLLLGFMSLFMVGLAPASGVAADRMGRRAPATAGAVLLATGVGMTVALEAGTSIWYLALALAVMGSGMGLLQSPNQTAAIESFPAELAGTAAGAFWTVRFSGSLLGTVLLGALAGSEGLTEVGSLRLLAIVLTVAGIGAILATRGLHRWPHEVTTAGERQRVAEGAKGVD